MAVAGWSKPCLQVLPAVPGVTEGRAAAVDTSWGLILAGALTSAPAQRLSVSSCERCSSWYGPGVCPGQG